MRILIGSPICKQNSIVNEFLKSLDEVNKEDNEIVYYFIDDNIDEESSKLLLDFSKVHNTILYKGKDIINKQDLGVDDISYDGKDQRVWTDRVLNKIALYKNTIIDYCLKENFDYLFLIDSDIVLNKKALSHLLSRDVEIVSNVFWNQWVKNGFMTPQCFWIPDIYLQDKAFNVKMTFQEAHKIRMDMIEQMKTPGIYEVDGLGACTLIKRSALQKGVNFTEISNLKIPGEDRPFCIRAGVAGIKLYMDTVYPAYHISKEKYLDRVDEYKRDGWKFGMCQTLESVEKKKKMNPIFKLIYRVCGRVARDISDKYEY